MTDQCQTTTQTWRLRESLKPSLAGQLGRVHRLWRQAITLAVQPLGMTEARWTVMMHLADLGEGCSQQALASELGIEMPSLTRTLNQLETQQLITRRVDDRDRRTRCLYFTSAGHACLKQLVKCIDSTLPTLYQGLDDHQLDFFASILQIMEQNGRNSIASHRSEAEPS